MDSILYTPTPFARANLLYLQEIGFQRAVKSYARKQERLNSFLCCVAYEGKGWFYYEGKTYFLKAGDVVFLDCQKPYSYSAEGPEAWSLQWCYFYGSSLPGIYAEYCERGGEPVITPEDPQVYKGLLTELYEIAGSDDPIRDMRINEKMGTLLTRLMSEPWRQGYQPERIKRADIQEIKVYLDEHYSERITLDAMAKRFFINKNYLARLFKEQYGMTLTAYIQQVRATHAKQMLRFTDKKVSEIGRECGFGELSYFSRMFRKIEGISPKKYRNMW